MLASASRSCAATTLPPPTIRRAGGRPPGQRLRARLWAGHRPRAGQHAGRGSGAAGVDPVRQCWACRGWRGTRAAVAGGAWGGRQVPGGLLTDRCTPLVGTSTHPTPPTRPPRSLHLYGDVYSSPGLSLRQKQLLTCAFLAEAHMPDQLFGHALAALRCGRTAGCVGVRCWPVLLIVGGLSAGPQLDGARRRLHPSHRPTPAPSRFGNSRGAVEEVARLGLDMGPRAPDARAAVLKTALQNIDMVGRGVPGSRGKGWVLAAARPARAAVASRCMERAVCQRAPAHRFNSSRRPSRSITLAGSHPTPPT